MKSNEGICFDQKMSFTNHIQNIVSSANRMLGFIIRNGRELTDMSVLILLYNSFVRSKLEYGALIWYPYYAVHFAQVERVQRKFLKYIYFRSHGVYPERGIDYSILLNDTNFIPLHTRRIQLTTAFLYNLLHNNIICDFLLSKISFNVPRLGSRYVKVFYCERARTNILNRSPVSVMCNNFDLIGSNCDINFSSLSFINKCILRLILNM